jgi:hypothetical protein
MRSIIPGVNFPLLDPCWLQTPAERSTAFLPAFVRMSVAIQTALREIVPARYFERLDRFREPKTAFPMLVYQASPPFRGKKRTELTYDVMNPSLIAMLFRRSKLRLIELLPQVELRLRAAQLPEATLYAPHQAPAILHNVQRLSKSRRYLFLLIRGESVLVDALIQLSGLGDLPPKAQTRKWASFGKRWNYQLRRMYPGCNCIPIACDLLKAAAAAMLADPEPLDGGGPGTDSSSLGVLQTSDTEFPEII